MSRADEAYERLVASSRQIVAGVTSCPYCGNLDESPECAAAGCWEPMTVGDLLLDNLADEEAPQWTIQ